MGEEIYACWLDSISYVSSAVKYRLFEAAGSAKGIYGMKESDLYYFVGEKACARIKCARKELSPEAVYEKMQKAGVKHTFCGAEDFPKRLVDIPDPPFGLFYKGVLPSYDTPAVAVIGARKCSEYGHCMAAQFAADFAKRGVAVVSGMALGIDGIAQRAALAEGGRSYAVLGCGVDVPYPKSNKPLYDKLSAEGGILSEYPLGTEPKPMFFPPRNRIISALSDAVLVVEAREKSGTLITVDMALEQGREVYAVPGRCTDGLSGGCNMLLRQGATAALCADDIVGDMGWDGLCVCADDEKRKAFSSYIKGLSPLAAAVCALLDILPVTQDTIIGLLREQGFTESVGEISGKLLELEFDGAVVREGGQYRLSDEFAVRKL